jgi:hypothetical protein
MTQLQKLLKIRKPSKTLANILAKNRAKKLKKHSKTIFRGNNI